MGIPYEKRLAKKDAELNSEKDETKSLTESDISSDTLSGDKTPYKSQKTPSTFGIIKQRTIGKRYA